MISSLPLRVLVSAALVAPITAQSPGPGHIPAHASPLAKGAVETPLMPHLPTWGNPPMLSSTVIPAPEFGSPKATPGLVRWHADVATAKAAAKESGRPLLVFQLLGNLDDYFC